MAGASSAPLSRSRRFPMCSVPGTRPSSSNYMSVRPPRAGHSATSPITLGVAAYVLLFAREIARPLREADVMREQALQQDVRLLAAAAEARLAPASAALKAGADLLTAQPTQALAAVERARVLAPDAAFAVIGPDGVVRAAAGAPAEAFQPRHADGIGPAPAAMPCV